MSRLRSRVILGVMLLSSPSLQAQEVGIFAAGGLGGLRDVRRPFGAVLHEPTNA